MEGRKKEKKRENNRYVDTGEGWVDKIIFIFRQIIQQ